MLTEHRPRSLENFVRNLFLSVIPTGTISFLYFILFSLLFYQPCRVVVGIKCPKMSMPGTWYIYWIYETAIGHRDSINH